MKFVVLVLPLLTPPSMVGDTISFYMASIYIESVGLETVLRSGILLMNQESIVGPM